MFLAWPLLSSNVDARISLGSIRRICGMVTSFSGCTLPLMKYVLTPEINRNECKPMNSYDVTRRLRRAVVECR